MARLIAGVFFALLFAVAAWVQRDDPDGETTFWIAAYAAVAVLSLMFAFRILPRVFAWPVALTALAGAAGVALQFSQTGEPWNPPEQFLAEEAREAGGLALAGVWLIVAGSIPRRRREPRAG